MSVKKIYTIYHNSSSDLDAFKIFKDNIANNYLSREVTTNMIILISSAEEIAFNIFKIVTKGIDDEQLFELGIFVITLDDYYGTLDKKTWDWLEEKTGEKLTNN